MKYNANFEDDMIYKYKYRIEAFVNVIEKGENIHFQSNGDRICKLIKNGMLIVIKIGLCYNSNKR